MRNKDVRINEKLNEEYLNHLFQEHDNMRNEALLIERNILELKEEKWRQFNKRKKLNLYKLNDLFAI